jgi:penicillin amidase
MNLSTRDILARLGRGDTIAAVSAAAGLPGHQFDAWWRDECQHRVPAMTGGRRFAGLHSAVRIERDRWGIPHIHAGSDADLFFGFGYATAQDRLFQLDYVRRKARGRLAEILGPEAVESDLLYRTVGVGAIAEREWDTLPDETRTLLTAYAAGVNAMIEESRDNLPIEFDLLDYRPEPWSPADSLAILGEFRWYLTGRFPVIVIPELVKRAVGDGPLYRAFLQAEADESSILQPGDYQAVSRGPAPTGGTGGGPDTAGGSNNWVLAGTKTETGKPLVASDPHIPFAAVSIWQEVHLAGGSFHVAGVALAGVPAIIIGRSANVAWGITNNICSQRDLYQEKTDPAHSGCFLYDGQWEPARQREEVIQVKGAEPVRKVIRSSRNGPIVDEVLPAAARGTGPVSLRWLGAEPCGWLTALLGMNRAHSCAEFRAATRPWLVPTFSLVFADTEGHIGYHCAGRIPRRRRPERGYRAGWDPAQQWDGLIPFEAMPHLDDPARGYIVTANNRVAADDYPVPLAGTWVVGNRARRIRHLIEATQCVYEGSKIAQTATVFSSRVCQQMQLDVRSERAAADVPSLLMVLAGDPKEQVRQAAERLAAWDFQVTKDSVPATLFNVFFAHWCRTVADERFGSAQAALIATGATPLAAHLLKEDAHGWFTQRSREQAIRQTFRAALDELTTRLGPDMSRWTWGRLHMLMQRHFLSGRGDLGKLLDRSGLPLNGDTNTVCSTTIDPDYRCSLGAGYRMVADLADPQRGLWAIEVASVSGHPGSLHYDDQLPPWSEGQYHYIALTAEAGQTALVLEPMPGS